MISPNTSLQISRQPPSSASTQKSIASPMHPFLGTNCLFPPWAEALCDTLLRYPMSSIHSSAFSITFWIDCHSSLNIYSLRSQHWFQHPARPASTSFAHTFLYQLASCVCRSQARRTIDSSSQRLFSHSIQLLIAMSPAYIGFLSFRRAVLSTSWPGLIRLSTSIFPSLGHCRLHRIRSRLANALGWRYGYGYCIQ
jgi:hypothetical protein